MLLTNSTHISFVSVSKMVGSSKSPPLLDRGAVDDEMKLHESRGVAGGAMRPPLLTLAAPPLRISSVPPLPLLPECTVVVGGVLAVVVVTMGKSVVEKCGAKRKPFGRVCGWLCSRNCSI